MGMSAPSLHIESTDSMISACISGEKINDSNSFFEGMLCLCTYIT